MVGDGWKWLKWLEITGYGWNGWTWLEMARNGWNGWKLLEIAGNRWNGWKLHSALLYIYLPAKFERMLPEKFMQLN